jgi:hypothetical protein
MAESPADPIIPNFENTNKVSPNFIQCIVNGMQARYLLILAKFQVIPLLAQLNISGPQLFVYLFKLLAIYVFGNIRLPQTLLVPHQGAA